MLDFIPLGYDMASLILLAKSAVLMNAISGASMIGFFNVSDIISAQRMMSTDCKHFFMLSSMGVRLDDYLLHLLSILPERAERNKDFEVDDLLPWSEEMKSWFSAV